MASLSRGDLALEHLLAHVFFCQRAIFVELRRTIDKTLHQALGDVFFSL